MKQSGGCARGLMRRGFGLGGLRRARPPKGRVDVAAGGRDVRAAVIELRMKASMVRARRARRCRADEQDGCDRGSSHGEPPLGLAWPMLGLARRGSVPRLRPRTSRSKAGRPVRSWCQLRVGKPSKAIEMGPQPARKVNQRKAGETRISPRPRRRPRSAFHADNVGSNPAGDASLSSPPFRTRNMRNMGDISTVRNSPSA